MRYRVFYQQDGACTDEDFCIYYADSEAEAIQVFHRYHPHSVIDHIEPYEEALSESTSLRALAAEADEHEFLVSLLEVIEEEGFEACIYRKLYKIWCSPQSE